MKKDSSLLRQLQAAFFSYDKERCLDLVNRGLQENIRATELIQDALMPLIQSISEKFEAKQVPIGLFILASEILRDCLNFLRQKAKSGDILQKATMIMGTVPGDIYYETRMQIITAIFEANGIHIINIGGNASGIKFLEAARAAQAKIIAISTYVQTAACSQKAVLKVLNESGFRAKFIVVIGGTGIPLGNWAQEIGADLVAQNLQSGLAQINRLLKEKEKKSSVEP